MAWRRRPLALRARNANLARIGVGSALFAASAIEARTRQVGSTEETVFRSLNDLPDRWHVPVWAVMQSGSLAAVGVAGAAAFAGHRRTTAIGLVAAGTAMWGGAKVVKHRFGRGRPAAHVDDVHVRGKEQTGLGFPSGHAAVSFALAGVAAPSLGPVARVAVHVAAATTAGARLYVGAHLPLDIAGGTGLGLAASGLTNLVLGDRRRGD